MRLDAAVLPRCRDALTRIRQLVPACALPAAVGALAFLVRLYRLGDKPFWMDEITSLHRATATLPDLVVDSLHRNHYPTYFLLLWLVARIGSSEFLLRLPSAVFGAVGAALVCAIGSRTAGRRSGAIAGLLMAISPFAVQLGQEARSYTLVSCLILVALFGLVRLAQQPHLAAHSPWRTPSLRGAWLTYCLGTGAALAVLNVALLWFVAANLGAVAIAGSAGRARWGFVRNWAGAQLLILALWLPLLAALTLGSEGGVGAATGWASGGRAATIWSIIAPVYLLRISNFITLDLAPAALPALSFAVAAMAAIGTWRLRRQPVVLVVLGLAAFLLPLGLVMLSWLVPVLVPRYFAWSAGPFFILAGAGIGQLRTSHFAALAAVIAAACLVNLSPYYDYETKPRWDQLATRLAADARPGDVVLVNDYYSYYVFSIFADRVGLANHGIKLRWELSEEARLTAERDQHEKSWADAIQGVSSAARLAAGHDLWVIYGRAGQEAMEPSEAYRRSLTGLGRPLAEFSVGRYIVAWRYRGLEETDPNARTATPQACSQPCGSVPPHP